MLIGFPVDYDSDIPGLSCPKCNTRVEYQDNSMPSVAKLNPKWFEAPGAASSSIRGDVGYTMRKLLLASVAAGALAAAGSAKAGDLPVPAYPPPPPGYPYATPPPPPPPLFSWSGCYVGGHVGWGWSKTTFQDQNSSSALIDSSALSRTASVNGNGGIFGGQLGCDFELGNNFVFGMSGSAAGTTITGSGVDPFALATLQSKTDFLGDLSLRVGFDWDRVLLYVKGGGALARNDFTYTGTGIFTGFNGTASNTPFGMIAGVGVEWSFPRNWSAFVEYDHYFFSSDTVTFNFPGPTNFLVNVSQNIDAVKGGINLRLNFGP
jgi:outer membrane immunogenic protein